MSRKISVEDTMEMTPQERWDLAQGIWQTLEAEPIGFSSEQRGEIERRLEEYERNPSDAVPWEEARRRLLGE
jgi:putative addiction module component (TIGR02574 family)